MNHAVGRLSLGHFAQFGGVTQIHLMVKIKSLGRGGPKIESHQVKRFRELPQKPDEMPTGEPGGAGDPDSFLTSRHLKRPLHFAKTPLEPTRSRPFSRCRASGNSRDNISPALCRHAP